MVWGTRVVVVLLTVVTAGCAAESARGARPWSAAVEVAEGSAKIIVNVPGQRVGIDFHVHLALDGGPEVMAYNPTYTFSKLPPGVHRVRVVIADPTHFPVQGMVRTLEFTTP